jgi:hypothetical protein
LQKTRLNICSSYGHLWIYSNAARYIVFFKITNQALSCLPGVSERKTPTAFVVRNALLRAPMLKPALAQASEAATQRQAAGGGYCSANSAYPKLTLKSTHHTTTYL